MKINKTNLERTLSLLFVNVVVWSIFFAIAPYHLGLYVFGVDIKNQPKPTQIEVLGVSLDTGEVLANNVQIKPSVGTKAWALQKWSNKFGAKVAWELEVIMDTKESGWDADAFNCNNNGSVDLSWYQLNSVHLNKVSLKCLADPICGTDLAMDLYEEQGWCPWYGAKKLGFCN